MQNTLIHTLRWAYARVRPYTCHLAGLCHGFILLVRCFAEFVEENPLGVTVMVLLPGQALSVRVLCSVTTEAERVVVCVITEVTVTVRLDFGVVLADAPEVEFDTTVRETVVEGLTDSAVVVL